jgi:hypothetical protein
LPHELGGNPLAVPCSVIRDNGGNPRTLTAEPLHGVFIGTRDAYQNYLAILPASAASQRRPPGL